MNISQTNIQEIIKGCIQKVPKDQALFVHTFSGLLYSICKRYLNNGELAKDALQESFMKIFNNIAQYDPSKGKIESWITTITIRHCLKQLQRKTVYLLEIENTYDEKLNFHPEILDKLNVEELIQMIHRLPVIYKEVFNLYEIDGYSHKEIGEMIGIDASSSRSRLNRAKSLLRKEILKIKNQESWVGMI